MNKPIWLCHLGPWNRCHVSQDSCNIDSMLVLKRYAPLKKQLYTGGTQTRSQRMIYSSKRDRFILAIFLPFILLNGRGTGQKYYGTGTLPTSQRKDQTIYYTDTYNIQWVLLATEFINRYKDWLPTVTKTTHKHIQVILFNRSVLRNLAWETNTKLVNLQLWPRVCWSLGAWLPTFAWYFTYDLTWNLALVANASHRMSGSAPNRPDFPEQDQNVHQLHLLFDHQNELVQWCCINSRFKLQISRSTRITPTWCDSGHIKEEAQTKIL